MYEEIIALRAALTEELKLELGGLPFVTDHHRIVEMRLQTALAVAARSVREEVEVLNAEAVEAKQKK